MTMTPEERLYYAALHALGYLCGASIMTQDQIKDLLREAIKGSTIWPKADKGERIVTEITPAPGKTPAPPG